MDFERWLICQFESQGIAKVWFTTIRANEIDCFVSTYWIHAVFTCLTRGMSAQNHHHTLAKYVSTTYTPYWSSSTRLWSPWCPGSQCWTSCGASWLMWGGSGMLPPSCLHGCIGLLPVVGLLPNFRSVVYSVCFPLWKKGCVQTLRGWQGSLLTYIVKEPRVVQSVKEIEALEMVEFPLWPGESFFLISLLGLKHLLSKSFSQIS